MTNADVVRRYIDEANNGGDMTVFDEVLAPGLAGHFGRPPDREALRAFVSWQRRTAPDWIEGGRIAEAWPYLAPPR